MNRITSLLLLTTAALTLTGCSSTRIVSSTPAPDAGPFDPAGKRIIALSVHEDASINTRAETALAKSISKRGAQGIPAHTIVPIDQRGDRERVRQAIKDSGADAVIVVRLVGAEETTTVDADYFDYHHYGTVMSYYDYSWNYAHDQMMYSRTYTTYIVETLCFRVADEKKLWAGTSETFSPNSVESLARDLVREAGKVMKKQGLIITP